MPRDHSWAAVWIASQGLPSGGRVGEVEVADRLDGHAVEDGRRADVDPLGDLGVPVSEELEVEQATRCPVADETHEDAVASGVVGR